jgi:hypothetical protein
VSVLVGAAGSFLRLCLQQECTFDDDGFAGLQARHDFHIVSEIATTPYRTHLVFGFGSWNECEPTIPDSLKRRGRHGENAAAFSCDLESAAR